MSENMNSKWLQLPLKTIEDTRKPTITYYRKAFQLNEVPTDVMIDISADTKYKLYVNGSFVEIGPSKGDQQLWYYDTINLASYLQVGENVLAVEVLRFPKEGGPVNQSSITTNISGLYVSGTCELKNCSLDLSSNHTWKCCYNDSIEIIAEAKGFAPLSIFENAVGNQTYKGWKTLDYDDSDWEYADPYHKFAIRDSLSPGNLEPRTIPFMYRTYHEFNNKKVEIPAMATEILTFDAKEEMTAYITMEFLKGKDASIEILQAESYVLEGMDPSGNPLKGNREDAIHGHLHGYADYYKVGGYGTTEKPEVYEPFWYRTFRYIQLKIVTGMEPLVIQKISYEETGYPLEIKTCVETSDESLQDVWDISARTLKRCMHETYEDCPFYEQLQYLMDSRSQILYTYASAADDRLARKCMDDFRRAARYDGMLPSAYPNTRPNVIPGFSIYYILMLHDHMMYFGDKELIRKHMPSVESILYFFEQNCTKEGYVGKVGGEHRKAKFWSFIDWTNCWSVGVPNATKQGAITMESLLYILGLQKAFELSEYIGRNDLAKEYKKQAKRVQRAVIEHCVGVDGMIQDGPGFEEYSQHAQVFAILTDTISKEDGKRNLLKTIENKEKYAQCSVSMALYLYQALEKVDLYEYTDEYWNIWRKMVENHMTTCAESDAYSRSDCHGWGALALYEMPAVILGVKPTKPGFEQVEIKPETGYMTWAKGDVATPKGKVHVSWKKENENVVVEYQVPEGMLVKSE